MQAIYALAKQVSEQIKISYEELMRENEWNISGNMFGIKKFTYHETEFKEDEQLICDNIRKLNIDSNNDLIGLNDCLQHIIELGIDFPSHPDLYAIYSEALDFQKLKEVTKLCLTNAAQNHLRIPESVNHMTLRNCDIRGIEWDDNLKVIRIEGENFRGVEHVKEALKSKPVAKQIWLDQEVDIADVGEYNELTNEVNGKSLYVIKEPHCIGGSDWQRIQHIIKSNQRPEYFIEHLFIDGNTFSGIDLISIIPIIQQITIDSLKISTMDQHYYDQSLKQYAEKCANVLRKSAEIDTATLHVTTEITYSPKLRHVQDEFYFNQELLFMVTDNSEFLAKNGDSVEYLVIKNDAVITQSQIDEFFIYCRKLKFLKLNSSNRAMSERIKQLPLSDGTQISNEYMEVLRKDQRTEVIFKANKNMIGDIGGFESISSTDTTYRFEFRGLFEFQYTQDKNGKRILSPFPEQFIQKVGELVCMKRMELAGNVDPLIDYIAHAYGSTKRTFLKLVNMVHIRIESERIFSIDFSVILPCLPVLVQYVTVVHPPARKLSNSSFDDLLVKFKIHTAQTWTQLKFLGNRLANHFVFANAASTNPSQDEIKELAQEPSLEKEFAELIKSKRPDSLRDMLVKALK